MKNTSTFLLFNTIRIFKSQTKLDGVFDVNVVGIKCMKFKEILLR